MIFNMPWPIKRFLQLFEYGKTSRPFFFSLSHTHIIYKYIFLDNIWYKQILIWDSELLYYGKGNTFSQSSKTKLFHRFKYDYRQATKLLNLQNTSFLSPFHGYSCVYISSRFWVYNTFYHPKPLLVKRNVQ